MNFIFNIDKTKERINTKLVLTPMSTISVTNKKGSYSHHSLHNINKNVICGVIENLIGLHLDLEERKKIVKVLTNINSGSNKKVKLNEKDMNFTDNKDTKKSYLPIIFDMFEINHIDFVEGKKFTDPYSYLNSRLGDDSHFNGANTIGRYALFSKKEILDSIKNESKCEITKDVAISQMPRHYTSLYKREHEIVENDIVIGISMCIELYNEIKNVLEYKQIGYLGNSESIVNIKLI